MQRNPGALLALAACILSLLGLGLSLLLSGSIYLSIQSSESALFSQLDYLSAALSSSQSALDASAISEGSSARSYAMMASAASSYADSSRNVSESLSSIAAVPPFSLDSRLSSAAKSFRQASSYFGNASLALSASSRSSQNASEQMAAARDAMGAMSLQLEASSRQAKDAFFTLKAGLFALSAVLVLLFLSVLALAVSALLPMGAMHPGQKGGEQGKPSEPGKTRPEEPIHFPPGYKTWQPGQFRPYRDREGGK